MTAPDPPRLTAIYERKFSDGNYGSEGITLVWTGDPGEHLPTQGIVDDLRRQVLTFLSWSASYQVARAAATELQKPWPPKARELAAEPELEDVPF